MTFNYCGSAGDHRRRFARVTGTTETPGGRAPRRRGTWAAAVGVLLAVSACAPTTGAPGSPSPGAAGAQAAAAGSAANPAGGAAAAGEGDSCSKATKAKIVEKSSSGTADTYAFSPRRLTIQRGGFLAITNRSGRVHTLVSKPDAGIVTSILDLKERQVIQFPTSGTFTVQSAAAAHRAVLRVTVTGESGCGATKSTLTIIDGFAIRPAKLSVAATENFAVVNDSGKAHTLTCAPDSGGNRDNSRLDKGETQLLAIDQPGRYLCTSIQHPDAKVTIKVNAK
jgi:plastocyanin